MIFTLLSSQTTFEVPWTRLIVSRQMNLTLLKCTWRHRCGDSLRGWIKEMFQLGAVLTFKYLFLNFSRGTCATPKFVHNTNLSIGRYCLGTSDATWKRFRHISAKSIRRRHGLLLLKQSIYLVVGSVSGEEIMNSLFTGKKTFVVDSDRVNRVVPVRRLLTPLCPRRKSMPPI